MTQKADLEKSGADADIIARLFETSDQILIKKLSNNDRDWARFPNKHQAGVYIPHEQRDSEFFPQLAMKMRDDPEADEIREAYFKTVWPQSGEERTSRLVHYTSKGQETHLTRLPKPLFADLLPASFVVVARMGKAGAFGYECLTIDSGSDEAELLSDLFGLSADFLVGIFRPSALKASERDKVLDFADEVIAAWLKGEVAKFAEANATMPPTIELARKAQLAFLKKYELESINPFVLPAPGDALREISRSIEWDLFREYQRRERSVELVRLILGDEPRAIKPADIIRELIDQFPKIDAIMLSASQQRKSRAGYSYEHHIEAMLAGGQIPFEKQVILQSKKRPDFILPSLAFVDSEKEGAKSGLILSAKTTLRERWKQVEREMGSRRLFLTTVDENIASSAIEDMASICVHLVIPESLLKAKESEYAGHKNVLSFAQFCRDFVWPHLPSWKTKPRKDPPVRTANGHP